MNVELVNIESLQLFSKNPRTPRPGALEKLRASVARFGWFKPVVVWRGSDGPVVIAGNRRVEAALAAVAAGDQDPRFRQIPTVEFVGTWEEARLVAIRDNEHDADWDWEQLPEFIGDLAKDLEALGAESMMADLALSGMEEGALLDLLELAGTKMPAAPSPTPGVTPGPTSSASSQGPDSRSSNVRRKARLVIGSVRGEIETEDHNRFLAVVERYQRKLNTSDLRTIFVAILDALEAT